MYHTSLQPYVLTQRRKSFHEHLLTFTNKNVTPIPRLIVDILPKKTSLMKGDIGPMLIKFDIRQSRFISTILHWSCGIIKKCRDNEQCLHIILIYPGFRKFQFGLVSKLFQLDIRIFNCIRLYLLICLRPVLLRIKYIQYMCSWVLVMGIMLMGIFIPMLTLHKNQSVRKYIGVCSWSRTLPISWRQRRTLFNTHGGVIGFTITILLCLLLLWI